jgi:hypothetical protein
MTVGRKRRSFSRAQADTIGTAWPTVAMESDSSASHRFCGNAAAA